VNAATNQVVGQSYDANGNQTSSPLGPLVYDAENRMTGFSNGSTQYGYDSRNKRVWKGTLSGSTMAQEVYFYGVDGQKLGTYAMLMSSPPGVVMADSASSLAVFFGGKRVGITTSGSTAPFVQDRLGSSNGKFYPYGEARGAPPVDTVGFATYTQDSATGLAYADQRYYASNFGRFMSPDPYNGSATAGDPGSWNRYQYVNGDPVNHLDPNGLEGIPEISCYVGQDYFYGTLCDLIYDSLFQNIPGPFANKVPKNYLLLLGAQDARQTTLAARKLLLQKLSGEMGTNCADVLSTLGVSPGTWDDIAYTMGFFNMTIEGQDLTMGDLYHGKAGDQASETLSDWFNSGPPAIAAVPVVGGVVTTDVFLGIGYMISSTGRMTTQVAQMDTLWHEFWHVATGMNDSALAALAGYGDVGDVSTASGEFDKWLNNDCKKP
jgi:RHS repeat-associated protein